MRVIVTAGPTYEPLDSVRRLTNFSTGRLGVELARFFTSRGDDLLLLLGEQATWPAPDPGPRMRVERFGTTADLRDRLAAHAAHAVDAVLHAAAVSDFRFGAVHHRRPDGTLVPAAGGKIPTQSGPLMAELIPTPKVIAHLREWFPRAWIAGWKYEVEGPRDEVIAHARAQTLANQTQACVANGPGYGAGYGLVIGGEAARDCPTRQSLFEALAWHAAGGTAVNGPS
jgi:phosphopantothenoylcysteine decarboxylase/phosphopantothenate--cysteine ligase